MRARIGQVARAGSASLLRYDARGNALNELYGSLPSLLAATVAFAIGTSVVLRDRSRDEFVLFAVFCFNLGLFHLASFFHGFSGIPLFGWGAQSISLVLPWTADRCVTALLPGHPVAPEERTRSRFQTLMLVLLLGAHATALFVLLGRSDGDELSQRQSYWDFTQWGLWDLVSLGLQVYVILGLLVVALRLRRAAKQSLGTAAAPRLSYLFYASLVAIAFGSPAITAIGPVVTAVYLYFVAQTLLRERLLELPELAARILTLTLLIVGVTGLLALLLMWIPEQGEGGGMLFVFNSAVAAFALIVLLDPVRAEVQSRVEAWLFRDRAELRALLVELRFRLLNVIDAEEMVALLLDALQRSNRVTRASIFLLDARGTSLVLSRELGSSALATTRIDVAKRRPLIERMRTAGPQLRDVLQRERERASAEAEIELQDCLDSLSEVGAALAVPIVSTPIDERDTPELFGVIFVDDERLIEPFSSEEVELFRQLASQAAITLQNSVVYEQRKERERLAALGEMAAGLAHEIRNPLGAIKGAVQVLEPAIKSTSDAMTAEFLGVIVEEVDRLNRVVVQFLSYSRPFSGAMVAVDLAEVVKATLRLVPAARLERVRVDLGVFGERRGEVAGVDANRSSTELRLEPHAPALRGDHEALRQVLHNLVLNALDATEENRPEPGHVWIELEHRVRGLPDTDAIALTVRDDGPGISPKQMANLFVPFHTTKTGGTGLGLPISQRIVENHGGMIAVSNNPDRGASFTVLLPIHQGITSTSQ
jgi:signal transduction histidine kinase